MEALLLLIALTAFFGVLVWPAMRRRRLASEGAGHGRDVSRVSAYGFVRPEELDVRLPGPDPQLVEALDEAGAAQDWHQIGRLMALTGDEYELRWQRVQSAAGAAARELAQARAHAAAQNAPGRRAGTVSFTKDPGVAAAAEAAASVELPDAGWLREWRAERPADPGAAQVYAQFLVWQGLAEDPASDSRRIILEEARTVCREAAELAPQDPTPYLSELLVATALGYRRADFEALWSEVTRRAPGHMGAHLAALPYWSENGRGSKEEADAFARTAAAQAPEGTLLPALPMFALYEHLPEVNLVRSLYQSAEVERAIEAAEFAVDQVEDDHPVRPHVLHLLVCMLVCAERHEEALEALAVVDGYVGAKPWSSTPDPAGVYAAFRARAVAGYESAAAVRTDRP